MYKRQDWNGTLPTETVKLALTEQLKKDLQDIRYDPADYEAVNLPAMGKNNGITLYEMIGLDYDDPKLSLIHISNVSTKQSLPFAALLP